VAAIALVVACVATAIGGTALSIAKHDENRIVRLNCTSDAMDCVYDPHTHVEEVSLLGVTGTCNFCSVTASNGIVTALSAVFPTINATLVGTSNQIVIAGIDANTSSIALSSTLVTPGSLEVTGIFRADRTSFVGTAGQAPTGMLVGDSAAGRIILGYNGTAAPTSPSLKIAALSTAAECSGQSQQYSGTWNVNPTCPITSAVNYNQVRWNLDWYSNYNISNGWLTNLQTAIYFRSNSGGIIQKVRSLDISGLVIQAGTTGISGSITTGLFGAQIQALAVEASSTVGTLTIPNAAAIHIPASVAGQGVTVTNLRGIAIDSQESAGGTLSNAALSYGHQAGATNNYGILANTDNADSGAGWCAGTAGDTCTWRSAVAQWFDATSRWIMNYLWVGTYACIGCNGTAPVNTQAGSLTTTDSIYGGASIIAEDYFSCNSGTPTITPGPGLGTTPSLYAVSGSNQMMHITVRRDAAGACASCDIAYIAFTKAWPSATPICNVVATNGNAAAYQASSTNFISWTVNSTYLTLTAGAAQLTINSFGFNANCWG
jgi:hypothetical protein